MAKGDTGTGTGGYKGINTGNKWHDQGFQHSLPIKPFDNKQQADEWFRTRTPMPSDPTKAIDQGPDAWGGWGRRNKGGFEGPLPGPSRGGFNMPDFNDYLKRFKQQNPSRPVPGAGRGFGMVQNTGLARTNPDEMMRRINDPTNAHTMGPNTMWRNRNPNVMF